MARKVLYGIIIPVAAGGGRTEEGKKHIAAEDKVKLYCWSDGSVTWNNLGEPEEEVEHG